MVDFKAMKANRQNRLESLKQELANAGKKKTFQNEDNDPTFWKLEVDKAGNGFAVIRFLDSDKEIPYVTYWDHGFKGPGGYYIEKSLTSIGLPDPVADLNSKLWKSGDKDTARAQKRRLHHVSNILVIKDSKNPDNEGKVFKFKYGVKIMEKLNEAMMPPFDEEGRSPDDEDYDPVNAFNPFCIWNGAALKLAARKVKDFRNYDSSEFQKQSPLAASEEEMEEIMSQTYDLDEILDPSNFKTREELEARLNKILGNEVVQNSADRETKEAPSRKTKESTKTSIDEDEDEIDLDALIGSIESE